MKRLRDVRMKCCARHIASPHHERLDRDVGSSSVTEIVDYPAVAICAAEDWDTYQFEPGATARASFEMRDRCLPASESGSENGNDERDERYRVSLHELSFADTRQDAGSSITLTWMPRGESPVISPARFQGTPDANAIRNAWLRYPSCSRAPPQGYELRLRSRQVVLGGHTEGRHSLEGEILARGYVRGDLRQGVRRGRFIEIPIGREDA
ncbi:hypothetical protein [Microterricola viridarii]|uniref:hypothetical protein n=1 Tax=Microterricola viridarii TaxID=412690 RepID=UPI0009F4B928|nr:hypothetical protein [Microterricola viridarii]